MKYPYRFDIKRIFYIYGVDNSVRGGYLGFNSRLDELQAAFLRKKLPYLDKINTHKRNLARVYLNNIGNQFIKPAEHPGYFDVFHIYNVRHPKRDALKKHLLEKGVQTDIHYPIPPHQQAAYRETFRYPLSEEIHATTLSLPIAFFHPSEDIMYVCEIINSFKY